MDLSELAKALTEDGNLGGHLLLKCTVVREPVRSFGATQVLREQCLWPGLQTITKEDLVFEDGIFSLEQDDDRVMCVVSRSNIWLSDGTLQMTGTPRPSLTDRRPALVFDEHCTAAHLSNLRIQGVVHLLVAVPDHLCRRIAYGRLLL